MGRYASSWKRPQSWQHHLARSGGSRKNSGCNHFALRMHSRNEIVVHQVHHHIPAKLEPGVYPGLILHFAVADPDRIDTRLLLELIALVRAVAIIVGRVHLSHYRQVVARKVRVTPIVNLGQDRPNTTLPGSREQLLPFIGGTIGGERYPHPILLSGVSRNSVGPPSAVCECCSTKRAVSDELSAMHLGRSVAQTSTNRLGESIRRRYSLVLHSAIRASKRDGDIDTCFCQLSCGILRSERISEVFDVWYRRHPASHPRCPALQPVLHEANRLASGPHAEQPVFLDRSTNSLRDCPSS